MDTTKHLCLQGQEYENGSGDVCSFCGADLPAPPVRLTTTLQPVQAAALAQFIKRVTYDDARECALSRDEAYAMLQALDVIGQELQGLGYAPR